MEAAKYQNSKVYKIIDNTENQYYYIGSTHSTLSKRLYNHKQEGRLHPEQRKNKYFNSIDWNVRIILINEFKLENKDQLRREEDKIIRECINDPKCLNMRREIITPDENRTRRKQYTIDHQEHKTEYDREYREINKERIKQIDSIIFTCICGSSYNGKHKTRHEKTKKHQSWLTEQKQTPETN